ncbi:MAG: helix-turn-helix domain-containing protein [Hyphomicrobiales bacterium]|nr:helix-turn-helix domain-containing protein [Hyphomicrobiales bacterium]
MSIEALNWAYRQPVAGHAAKFLLVTLCNYADADGFCYPSQERLAAMTGMSVRTVRSHLAALERAGFIKRENRRDEGGRNLSHGFLIQQQISPVDREKSAEAPADPLNRASGNNRQRQDLPAAKIAAGTLLKPKDSPPMVPPSRDAARKGTRMPDGFTVPRDWQAEAVAQGLDGTAEAVGFVEYYTNDDGRNKRRVSWHRSWLAWLRKAHEFKRRPFCGKGAAAADDEFVVTVEETPYQRTVRAWRENGCHGPMPLPP